MSSKRAMKQAQKQAYAKHRSNITNNRFGNRKKNFSKKNKNFARFLWKVKFSISQKSSETFENDVYFPENSRWSQNFHLGKK